MMRIFIGTLGSVLMILVFSSCDRQLDRQKYISKIMCYESGLHRKAIVGDFYFDILYTPAAYMVLKRENRQLTRDQVVQMAGEIEGLQYYQFEIGMKDGDSDIVSRLADGKKEKEQLLHYFSFGLQDDIYLEVARKRLPCKLFHFERSFDLKNSRRFLLGFDADSISDQCKFVIDSPVFNDRLIEVVIDKRNIPEL